VKSDITIAPEALSIALPCVVTGLGKTKLKSSMPKSRTESPPLPTPRLALSIPEFCEAHGISEGLFYKLKKQGEGPREMKVGARTLISFESAAEWRRAREARYDGCRRGHS
jgi:predicted DNA-binding transcriptional regulator AlpA